MLRCNTGLTRAEHGQRERITNNKDFGAWQPCCGAEICRDFAPRAAILRTKIKAAGAGPATSNDTGQCRTWRQPPHAKGDDARSITFIIRLPFGIIDML